MGWKRLPRAYPSQNFGLLISVFLASSLLFRPCAHSTQQVAASRGLILKQSGILPHALSETSGTSHYSKVKYELPGQACRTFCIQCGLKPSLRPLLTALHELHSPNSVYSSCLLLYLSSRLPFVPVLPVSLPANWSPSFSTGITSFSFEIFPVPKCWTRRSYFCTEEVPESVCFLRL